MALTRPKIAQIYTNVTALTDAITVLNAGANQANVDVGFLINRAHGLVSNAAIYYSESLDGFVTAFTSNSGGTDSNIVVDTYANITAGNIYTTGLYWTGNGAPFTISGGGGTATYPDQTGNAGKFLTTDGSNVSWAAVSGGTHSSGTTPHSSPATGDTWYNTTNDILYHYVNDGVNSFWIDIESPISFYDDTPGEIYVGNVRADGYFWSNGTAFISGSGSDYGNANVAVYLPAYTGNISAGNITVTGNIVGGGVRSTSSATPPSNPTVGDMWYDTSTDILFRYSTDGTTKVWLDIVGAPTQYSAAATSAGTTLTGTTTNSTETEIFVDGVSNSRIAVTDNKVSLYTIDIVARRTDDPADSAAWTLKAVAKRVSGTTSDVGNVYEIVIVRTDSNLAVDVRSDNTNDTLNIYVTGVTGKTFNWKASVTVVEV